MHRSSAPAARRRATTGASAAPAAATPTVEAFVVTTPRTSMLSLTATGTPCSGPSAAARPGGRTRDHRVQARPPVLEARVRGEQLEVRHLAAAAAVLDLVDQLERAPQERPVDVLEDRGLGLALAHREVAVDAGVRLRRAPVELDETIDGAVEVVGIEAVERLGRDRRDGEHLLGEPHEEGAVARLGERIGDREVGDGGGEEHRAVGLLRPEVAEDVGRALRVREVAHEPCDALAFAAVELADVERALAADEDPARREVVGAEVHERADRPLLADRGRRSPAR